MFDFFKKLLGFKEKPLPPPHKEKVEFPPLPRPSPSEEKLEKEDVDVVEEPLVSAVDAVPVEPVMKENEEQEPEVVETTELEEEAYVTVMPEQNLNDSDDFNPVIDDEEHEGDRELRALEEEEESD